MLTIALAATLLSADIYVPDLRMPEVAGVGLYHPKASKEIIHVLDWHWVGKAAFLADGGKEEDYAAFLDTVDKVQLNQMKVLRATGVKEVWIEGQSDKTIEQFNEKVEKLKKVKLPKGDSDVDKLIKELYREDLLQIGAAGRLLLEGETEKVLPLEDHEAWQEANPIRNGKRVEIREEVLTKREREMVKRVLGKDRAVIVVGGGHKLLKYVPADTAYKDVVVVGIPKDIVRLGR